MVTVAVGGALLTACADDDSSEPGDGAGQAGGTLIVGTTNTFATFDPYNQTRLNYPAFHTMYSYLIEYDDDVNPVPSLAESWDIATDHTSVTISLREVTFHSGAEVTADDVVAGVERAQDPELGLSQYAGGGASIAGAEALDDRTVRVTFNGPRPDDFILDWMSNFPVVEAGKNDPNSLQQAPAGSGPFLLDVHDPGVSLSMVKNPEYWEEGKPYLDAVEFQFFGDQNAIVAGLESGAIDAAMYVAPSFAAQLEGAGFNVNEGVQTSSIGVIYVSTKVAPFDNKLVRQAIQRAIDRERFAQEARYGFAVPVYSIFAPVSQAYDESYLDTLSYDLEAARQLLEQSGAELAGTLSVPSSDPVRIQEAEILQADLRSIGFDLEIETLEVAAFSSRLNAGELGLAMSATGSAPRSVPTLADPRVAPSNNALWPDGDPPQAWGDALEAASNALTDSEAQAAYAEMNRVLTDEAWVIGTTVWYNLFVSASTVHDFQTDRRDQVVVTNTTVDH